MKPHKGKIIELSRVYFKDREFVILCKFVNHPRFAGRTGHTSLVVKSDEDKPRGLNGEYEIETLNSRYTVIPDTNLSV